MATTSILRIEFPALSEYVAWLKYIDARDQQNIQRSIDEATAKLRTANDETESALEKGT